MAQQAGVGAVRVHGHLIATVAYTIDTIVTSKPLLGDVPMQHLVIRRLLVGIATC